MPYDASHASQFSIQLALMVSTKPTLFPLKQADHSLFFIKSHLGLGISTLNVPILPFYRILKKLTRPIGYSNI